MEYFDIGDSSLEGYRQPPYDPELEELLTLPPHRSSWLQEELNSQVRQWEQDVQALLIDDNLEVTNHENIIELISLPRDRCMGRTTPLFDSSVTNGRKLKTWSMDDFDLSTWNGNQLTPHRVGRVSPSHIWISLPWGPKWVTGHTSSFGRRWIKNVTKLAYLQIELGGDMHLEGPTDSSVWKLEKTRLPIFGQELHNCNSHGSTTLWISLAKFEFFADETYDYTCSRPGFKAKFQNTEATEQGCIFARR